MLQAVIDNAPSERTYTMVHLGIAAPDSQTLPVIVELDDPEHPVISLAPAMYARKLQRDGTCSYETIVKSVRAIGKLRDFYLLVRHGEPVAPGGMRTLLEDFLFAFDHGSELGWSPATNDEYLTTRKSVFDYVKFLAEVSGIAWSRNELEFIEDCRKSWQDATYARHSLLFHTKKRGRKKSRGRKKVITGLKQYKPFPPRLVHLLIETTKNVRDKLLFALLGYGGRRLSEMLHLFMQDLEARDNKLRVVLRHPSQSPMSWQNKAGKLVKGTRREYLKTMFDRLPRTESGALKVAVGWKGVKFDDSDSMTADLYFTCEVEEYLLQLHRVYLNDVRAKVPRKPHPYYFVNEKGLPLTIGAVEKQFKLACRRLEKKCGISLAAYAPHCLRHYYGFYCADVLRVDLLMIQKWMGHTDPSSTAVYVHISPETARDVLSRAEKTAAVEGRIKLSESDRARIANEFAVTGLDPIPKSWRLGSTIHGILDTTKLTRALI